MEHLVKKYIRRVRVGEDVRNVIDNAPIDEKALTQISQIGADGYYALGITADNDIVQTFKYNEKGKIYFIPEPNPIVIYFDTARHYHKSIITERQKLFIQLSQFGNNMSAINGNFYWYFSIVCSFIIFLFLSLEAFVNKIIPNEFEYKKDIQKRKTELYNKYQIQRHVEFLEKIRDVLPLAVNKDFVRVNNHKYALIKNLKDFRDEIVHTKSFEGQTSPNFYEDLYVKSLNFDFDSTLNVAKDFINYFEPNLIEECGCGKII